MTNQRDIRFRVWDTKGIRYLKEVPMREYMLDCDDWHHLDDEDMFHWTSAETYKARLIWEQYTGFKDKDGREVFEGDVVCLNEGTKDKPWLIVGMVTYLAKNGCYILTNPAQGPWARCDLYLANDIEPTGRWKMPDGSPARTHEIAEWRLEVIGNIHQNPDLLKGSLSREAAMGEQT